MCVKREKKTAWEEYLDAYFRFTRWPYENITERLLRKQREK